MPRAMRAPFSQSLPMFLVPVLSLTGLGGCGGQAPPEASVGSGNTASGTTARSTRGVATTARLAGLPRPPIPATSFVPADGRLVIARSMLRGSRFDQAETALRTILLTHPQDAQTLFLLGLAVQKQKRYSDARAIFEEVIDRGSPFPEIDHLPYAYAWCAYNVGDLSDAREAFEEHLRRVPEEPDSVFGLGVIALDDDRLDDAERHFTRAIELQASLPSAARDLAKAHARLADVHVRRDRTAEAEAALRTAVALYPDHYEAWAKLARILEREGKPESAAEARKEETAAMQRVGRLGDGSNQDNALPPRASNSD